MLNYWRIARLPPVFSCVERCCLSLDALACALRSAGQDRFGRLPYGPGASCTLITLIYIIKMKKTATPVLGQAKGEKNDKFFHDPHFFVRPRV